MFDEQRRDGVHASLFAMFDIMIFIASQHNEGVLDAMPIQHFIVHVSQHSQHHRPTRYIAQHD